MEQELTAVSQFLSSFLPPRDPPCAFGEHLAATLALRFAGHWHPSDPERGSAYRALVRTPVSIDISILKAAALAGLTRADLERALASGEGKVWLGDRWTLWVDPGCVSLRLERGDGSISRDGQLIEIWGKLPETVRTHSLPLASFEAGVAAARSFNIATPDLEPARLPSPSPPTAQNPDLLSPTKRSSKAIQILPPPGRVVSGSSSFIVSAADASTIATSGVSTVPSSPAGKDASTIAPTALLASPFIIPPTPIRPIVTNEVDVFSPSPATSSSGIPAPSRTPSPLSSDGTYSSLAPSPLGFPLFKRRSSSAGSSISSSHSTGDSSDGEGSSSDGLFSSSESISSSVTSVGTSSIWKALSGSSVDQLSPNEGDEFTYPRRSSGSTTSPFMFPPMPAHTRSLSAQTLAVPTSPSKSSHGGRSLPSSPSKPRRRGTRGGSGSHHGHSSSISSVTSVGSAQSTQSNVTSTSTGTSASRTREQALAGVLTEHSGGKVGVLGGGVLLGLAGGAKSNSRSGDVVSGENKRRGRERRRGGQARKEGGANAGVGAVAPASLSYLLGATPYSMPASTPIWG